MFAQLFGGRGTTATLGDLWKIDTSASAPAWMLLSPTGSVPEHRSQPSMAHAGNGLVYMMGFGTSSAQSFEPRWHLYVLDTKPATPTWTILAHSDIASWARTAYPKYVHVWNNHLYVMGIGTVPGACSWSSVFRINLTLPTTWTNITEMSAAEECNIDGFWQNNWIIRSYRRSGSMRNTNNFVIFDLNTLATQVNIHDDILDCIDTLGSSTLLHADILPLPVQYRFGISWIKMQCLYINTAAQNMLA